MIGTWTDVQGDSTSTNRLVTYTYDNFGNQAAVTTYSDANTPRVTSYTYDKNNRVTKIVYPSDTTEGDLLYNEYFQYDDLGNLSAKLVGMVSGTTITAGNVTAYAYDSHNRLEKVKYNYSTSTWPISSISITSGDVEYAYDGDSSLRTSMVDACGTSEYTYDDQGRLKTYTPPVGLDSGYYVSYDYNNLGQKTAMKITNGSTTPYDVSYDYFANGWLKDVKSGASTIASYGYDYVGNRLTQTNGNGTYTSYDYDTDPRYRLDSISHYKSSSPDVLLAEIEYPTRDDAGNPESMTDWTGTWSYGYDDNNRLTSAAAPNPIPDQPAGGNYGYDWVGNRVHPPADPNSMTYNKADQLTSWPGMHTYTYYGDGSLHEVKTGQTTVASYTYTPDGLLSTASYNGRMLTNTWDADENRVGFTAEGNSHTFVNDITIEIPAFIKENGMFYIREPDGSLITRIYDTDINYYHFDRLGSTRLLTNASGNITDKYAYDAYGSLIAHDRLANSIDQPYQYVGLLGYYTHWQEPEFGLLQLGVRFYDSSLGSFMQRDALNIQAMSSYLYCNARPTVMQDAWGFAPSPSNKDIVKCFQKAAWDCKDKKNLKDYLSCVMSKATSCLGKKGADLSCEDYIVPLSRYLSGHLPNGKLWSWLKTLLGNLGNLDPEGGNPCKRKGYGMSCCDAKTVCKALRGGYQSTEAAKADLQKCYASCGDSPN